MLEVKRHIITDTIGNFLEIVVHTANIQDRDGAKLGLNKLSSATKVRLQKIGADGGYRGQLVEWVKENLEIALDIVARDPGQKGFQVLPWRWVVERTFAWLGRCLPGLKSVADRLNFVVRVVSHLHTFLYSYLIV